MESTIDRYRSLFLQQKEDFITDLFLKFNITGERSGDDFYRSYYSDSRNLMEYTEDTMLLFSVEDLGRYLPYLDDNRDYTRKIVKVIDRSALLEITKNNKKKLEYLKQLQLPTITKELIYLTPLGVSNMKSKQVDNESLSESICSLYSTLLVIALYKKIQFTV